MSFETLEIQISDNSEQAVSGIDRLTATLNRLKSATANSAGLGKVADKLKNLGEAILSFSLCWAGPRVYTTHKTPPRRCW